MTTHKHHMNIKHIFTVLSLLILFNCSPTQSTIDLYVSASGKSENSGEKNAPFSNISEALKKAKTLKARDQNAIININISSGDYVLSAPIIIDNYLNNINIIGSGSSEVTLKGSVPLSLNWEKLNDSIYVSAVSKTINFDQLVVNDSLQILARYPNYNENGKDWQGHAPDAISVERIASWENPIGGIVHAMHAGRWGGFHYTISGINEDGTAILEGGHQNNRPSEMHKKYRMVENIFEELDSPGEWFLDKQANKLYYYPTKDVNIKNSKFEGVQLKNLITIKGTKDVPVKNVSIKGIKFQYAKRTFMENYEPLLRSDWTIYRGGAIFYEYTENCKISDCELTNLGGNAIFVSAYNRDLEIASNHIHECGASGISFIGHPSAVRSPAFTYREFVDIEDMDTITGPKNDLYPKNCKANDNLIYRIGRIEKQTAGVQISMAMDITVDHNSIYDVPRAGINVSEGTWGGHIISNNDVFNTVLESGDHGSFNSWGRDRFWHPNRQIMDSLTLANPKMPYWDAIHTTVIKNNRFRCDHGWDIDLDDGSSNYEIYNNVCLNGGLKLREGFSRTVENNIIVNNSFHPHVWFANSGDIFRKNIMTTGYRNIRIDVWGEEVDYNLFPNKEALEKAQENGTDAHSAFGNPKFKNPKKGDYTVAADSPALKLGFKNFPMNLFGVQNPELKAIAKTPIIPKLKLESSMKSNTENWLGLEVKDVETLGEQSASGLDEISGVLVLRKSNIGTLVDSEIQIGDAIISLEGKKVKNTDDLIKIYEANKSKETLKINVFRYQKSTELLINIK
ncbi:PDZ domain-containing protein [Formosa sp. PL04]|uniref:PDZ domain-containing protein n=1 Tax=Formosa sp. PL04 TaxID=3081755 RepID=UPI002981346C|nr:PDZ domain-containing protein [Formosa sp. PL04]MDW5290111.1 PDZ domain-containing protein [Formosa sp. PL04]